MLNQANPNPTPTNNPGTPQGLFPPFTIGPKKKANHSPPQGLFPPFTIGPKKKANSGPSSVVDLGSLKKMMNRLFKGIQNLINPKPTPTNNSGSPQGLFPPFTIGPKKKANSGSSPVVDLGSLKKMINRLFKGIRNLINPNPTPTNNSGPPQGLFPPFTIGPSANGG